MTKTKKMTPDEMSELAKNFYEGLSEEDIDEIERIALDRSNFLEPNRIHELLKDFEEEDFNETIET